MCEAAVYYMGFEALQVTLKSSQYIIRLNSCFLMCQALG
jgi:hypothetical protein